MTCDFSMFVLYGFLPFVLPKGNKPSKKQHALDIVDSEILPKLSSGIFAEMPSIFAEMLGFFAEIFPQFPPIVTKMMFHT